MITRTPAERLAEDPRTFKLDSGSRVGVIGGGPAGSFFSHFLLEMAERVGIGLQVDIYEPREFSKPGPSGCNMCGGVISESLVQVLAAEGINLPTSVVERGIDSYTLHMDVGSVRIETPLHEKRIAVVYRGAGPRGSTERKCGSFDDYLLDLAVGKGAHWVPRRVNGVGWLDGRPQIKSQDGLSETYDLLVVALGVNTALKLGEALGLRYTPPRTTKTYVREIHLGAEMVEKYLGSSMHLFLLNIPRLKFAALIPKGDCVTLCLLGQEIDGPLVQSVLEAREVRQCLPPDWAATQAMCHCSPWINVRGAVQPFADRVVFVGDCGVTRLYKDGIGAAYRTAKAAALTSVFEGVSAMDFRRHYLPVCRSLSADNTIGKVVFLDMSLIQKVRYARHGVLRMVAREQQAEGHRRRMSGVLWDVFTGSAPYRDIFLRMHHPSFFWRFLWNTAASVWPLSELIG